MFVLRGMRAKYLGSVMLALASMLAANSAQAKLPGVVHCYNDICHRVRTVAETEARRGIVEPLVASFYDSPEKDRFNPSLETSSGTQFEPYAEDNAASPIHPDGTVLLIWSPVTRGAAIIRINNAGPYYPGRTLDVSRGVAERLGFSNGGVMQLLTVVISAPSEPEAHYVRGRVYPKVRGYLGKFENIALASFVEPVARQASYAALTQASAISSSAQIALNVTEDYFRLSELAVAFRAAPAEIMPPPDAADVVTALYEAPVANVSEPPVQFASGTPDDGALGMRWTPPPRTAANTYRSMPFDLRTPTTDLGEMRQP